jgi:hypothetical protein
MKNTNTILVASINRMLIVFFALAIISGLTSCSKESATPTPATLPSAVAGLTVIGQDGQDTLTWSANYTDDNVKNYNVYAGTSESTMSLVGTSTKLSYLHQGLTNGTTYYYAISAVNAKGEGQKSTTLSAKPNTALNKQYTMFVPQVLPGALKAAPWRYYDPKDLYYSDNPFVITDTFKYIVQSRVYEGFDTAIFIESLNMPAPPSKYVLLNYYGLTPWNTAAGSYSKKQMQALDRISIWSTGITGQSTFDAYKILDTIPVSFYLQGDISNSKLTDVIKSIRLRIDGSRRLINESFLDKTYSVDQFVFHTQAETWDKINPSVFATSKGWLVVIPVTGSIAGLGIGTQNTLDGYDGMQIKVNYKDLTTNAKTLF